MMNPVTAPILTRRGRGKEEHDLEVEMVEAMVIMKMKTRNPSGRAVKGMMKEMIGDSTVGC